MAHGRRRLDEVKPEVTTALESGFDCAVVDRENIDRMRELGGIKVACFGNEWDEYRQKLLDGECAKRTYRHRATVPILPYAVDFYNRKCLPRNAL